jgi:hypothetical protein
MLSCHDMASESLLCDMSNDNEEQLTLPQTVAGVLAYTPLTTLTSILPGI